MANRKKLGEILVECGAATPDVIRRALGHQRQWGGRLGRILVEMDAVTDEQLARTLGAQSRMPLAKMKPDTPYSVASLVPVELAERYEAVAFGVREIEHVETVYVAIADPYDVVGMDEIRFAIGKPVKFAVAAGDEIRAAIERLRAMTPPAAPPRGPASTAARGGTGTSDAAGRASASAKDGSAGSSAASAAASRGGVPLARIQITQATGRLPTRPPQKPAPLQPLEADLDGPDDMDLAIDHSSPAEVLAQMVTKSTAAAQARRPAAAPEPQPFRPESIASSRYGSGFIPNTAATESVVLELSEDDVDPGAGGALAPALAANGGLAHDGLLPGSSATMLETQAARDAAALFDDWGPEVWGSSSYTPAPVSPPSPATLPRPAPASAAASAGAPAAAAPGPAVASEAAAAAADGELDVDGFDVSIETPASIAGADLVPANPTAGVLGEAPHSTPLHPLSSRAPADDGGASARPHAEVADTQEPAAAAAVTAAASDALGGDPFAPGADRLDEAVSSPRDDAAAGERAGHGADSDAEKAEALAAARASERAPTAATAFGEFNPSVPPAAADALRAASAAAVAAEVAAAEVADAEATDSPRAPVASDAEGDLEATLQAIADGREQSAIAPNRLLPALVRLLLERGLLAPRDLLGLIAAPGDRACGLIVKVLFELGWLDAMDLASLLGMTPERVCACLIRTFIGRARLTLQEVRRSLA